MALNTAPLSSLSLPPEHLRFLVEQAQTQNAELARYIREELKRTPAAFAHTCSEDSVLVIDFDVIDRSSVLVLIEFYDSLEQAERETFSGAALQHRLADCNGFVPDMAWVADFVESEEWKALSENPVLLHYSSQLAIYSFYAWAEQFLASAKASLGADQEDA